jgi:hypothetical protein
MEVVQIPFDYNCGCPIYPMRSNVDVDAAYGYDSLENMPRSLPEWIK